MAVTRADVILNPRGKREDFSDFLDSFAMTPVGNQLGKVTDVQSVNQSLKNLILTNAGERLFQPLVGCSIYNSLFELNDTMQASNIKFLIETTIKNNEPRASVIAVTVIPQTDNNAFGINIVYNLINSTEPVTLNFTLKRVR
jgi:phage baseplate assembly protein W